MTSRSFIGFAIRYHNGDFLITFSQLLDRVTMPEIAETLIGCGISFAHDEGLNKILLVSDCSDTSD